MNIPIINFDNIFLAQKFYQNYIYTSVPWIIKKNIIDITIPSNLSPTIINNNIEQNLVGSGEQGFLDLVINKNIKGNFKTITPCFRNDIEDDIHFKYFLKLELFSNNYSDSRECLDIMLLESLNFFSTFNLNMEIIKTEEYTSIESFDIIEKTTKIELGSYGIRKHDLVGEWIYGTGCAEPRLSYVINKVSK